MTETVIVRPMPGRRVRHPATAALLDGPVPLPRDAWLIRRLDEQDLQIAPPEPEPEPAKKART